MPTEAGEGVKEAEFEEVADAEVGEGADAGRVRIGKTGLICFPTIILADLALEALDWDI